jgi:hypothetical protein
MVLHAARYIKGGRKRWRPRERAARWVRSAFAPSVRFMRAEGDCGLHNRRGFVSHKAPTRQRLSAPVSACQRSRTFTWRARLLPSRCRRRSRVRLGRSLVLQPRGGFVFANHVFGQNRSTPVNTGQRRSTGVNERSCRGDASVAPTKTRHQTLKNIEHTGQHFLLFFGGEASFE